MGPSTQDLGTKVSRTKGGRKRDKEKTEERKREKDIGAGPSTTGYAVSLGPELRPDR